jgi:hypothetical protein
MVVDLNKVVLAMYDIRGKQEFIFRSNHLKEIVGGSAIIRDCFKDYLYPKAEKISEKGIFHDEKSIFDRENFKKHLEEGYIGEVVYEGGGNFYLLFKDDETFRKVTFLFSSEVMRKVGTLKVLGSYIKEVNFDDYKGDAARLREVHQRNEHMESVISPWGTLPIVQVDRMTSMPLVDKYKIVKDRKVDDKLIKGKSEKLSKESLAKYKKYDEELRDKADEIGESVLDNIVTKKGEDSLLAVVYIDGNNMGAKVEECYKGRTSYEECVAELRKFSNDIQKKYIDDRKKDIDEYLSTKYYNKGKRRVVLGAGDEVNFIFNVHDALDCARVYLENLPEGCSSCAGIAIFHSHAPYSEVYRIAEECCEEGKTKMKEMKLENTSLLDFQYCQGAIDVSLEQIRKNEHSIVSSKPWLIKKSNADKTIEGITDIKDVDKMKKFLNKLGNSNVKGLLSAIKSGETEFQLEMNRIEAHMPKKDREELAESFRRAKENPKLIYDMVITYDVWFKE